MKNLIYGLFIASFVLGAINYLISALYRKRLIRIIPCLNLSDQPVIITQIIRYSIIILLTVAYSALFFFEPDVSYLILHYRAFNRLFHAPFTASLESGILFIIMIGTES